MKAKYDTRLYSDPWISRSDDVIKLHIDGVKKHNIINKLSDGFDVEECEKHLRDTLEESMKQLKKYFKLKFNK